MELLENTFPDDDVNAESEIMHHEDNGEGHNNLG